MRFAMVIAIVADTLEEQAVNIAKEHGAGGVTLMKGSGIGLNEKKTFFGLTYERSESVLLFILEKKISLKVMKALNRELDLEHSGHGLVVSMPLDHIAGIPKNQLEKFQEQVKEEL